MKIVIKTENFHYLIFFLSLRPRKASNLVILKITEKKNRSAGGMTKALFLRNIFEERMKLKTK